MKSLIALTLAALPSWGAALAAPAADITGTGTYTVSATHDLAPVASFELQFRVHRKENGDIELHYQLPPELVGLDKPEIVLEQAGPEKNGLIPFVHGPQRESAACRHRADLLTCFVLYPDLDTTGATDYVKEKYAGQADLDTRLKLTQFFSTDPIGMVKVPLAD